MPDISYSNHIFISPVPKSPPSDKTPNFLKRWCLGVGSALFIQLPFTNLIGNLAIKVGLLPANPRGFAASLKPTRQKELEVIDPDYMKGGAQSERYILEIFVVAVAPVIEEALFRGLVQGVLFKRIPKKLLKRVAPGKLWIVDSRVGQAARIVLTSALFSLYHLTNRGMLSDDYVNRQLVLSFAQGLVLGAIKESKLGLTGAIAAHMTNNAATILVDRLR